MKVGDKVVLRGHRLAKVTEIDAKRVTVEPSTSRRASEDERDGRTVYVRIDLSE